MKQELIKKIAPIIETFVDDVLKSFEDIEKIRKSIIQKERELDDIIRDRDKEFSDIKKQKVNEKEVSDQKITDLEKEKDDYILKAQGYENLTNELKVKTKETESNLDKSKIEFIRSKDARVQTEKIKEDAQKLKKDYELKLSSLKVDFEKNVNGDKKNEEKDKKLTARENNSFANETRQNQRANDLNDQELRIKTERKEIDRLIKRYNLEESLKET